MSPALRALACAGATIALAVGAPPATAASPGSPAELAREQSEARRIESEFVAQVAAATGLPASSIERLLPAEPRIADRGKRLVQAIGKEIRALSDAEREAILRADEQRRNALAALRAR